MLPVKQNVAETQNTFLSVEKDLFFLTKGQKILWPFSVILMYSFLYFRLVDIESDDMILLLNC